MIPKNLEVWRRFGQSGWHMTITHYQRSIGPLWQLLVPGWRLNWGRTRDENHTLYSDGAVWWGAPYQRTITVHFLGFAFTVTQLRKMPAPNKGSGLP